MDGQLEPLRGDLAGMGIHLNTVSADEHVPEIEQYICGCDLQYAAIQADACINGDRNGILEHPLAKQLPVERGHV